MTRPPPSFSSAGWKMKYAVPSKFFRRASAAAAPSSIAVCAVVAAGVHLAATVDACATPDFSWMWSASRSARRPTAALRAAVAQHADHAGAGEAGVHVEAEPAQLVGDERARRRLLERGLGLRVEAVTPAAHLGVERGDFGDDVHGRTLRVGPAAIGPHPVDSRRAMANERPFDLLIIGGGINGAGIARDAAGRGLTVLLVEQGDLAVGDTSRGSHQADPRRAALPRVLRVPPRARGAAEREVLLPLAPHLVRPLDFVLPHEPHLRPAWMIRAGLFLYDQLGGPRDARRNRFGVELVPEPLGRGPQAAISRRGFVYFDCAGRRCAPGGAQRALRARARRHHPRAHALRRRAARGDCWRATLDAATARAVDVTARAMVNAAGPWVKDAARQRARPPSPGSVRLVKGSHIVVPRIHDKRHAYLLQNADRRIVFVIPYQERDSLIGTTDVPVRATRRTRRSPDEEIDYLLALARLSRDDSSRAPTSRGRTAACGRSTTTGQAIRRR